MAPSYCLRLGKFLLPATRGAPFLDPKFAQEHDERISFGHRARVQQPERARNQQPGRLPAGSPRARTHPTEIAARIQPDLRIQIVHALSQLDSCTRGGWEAAHAMEWSRLPKRRGLPISFEKSAARKLKSAYQLKTSAGMLT